MSVSPKTSFEALYSIDISGDTPVKNQIADRVRSLILGRHLPFDQILPGYRELAASWGTGYRTVQSAFAMLAAEGLVETRRKRGTLIPRFPEELSGVGIYYAGRIDSPEHIFVRLVGEEVQRLLSLQRIACRVWVETRPEDRQNEALGELWQAVQEREIQGLIVPLSNQRILSWVSRLPIPFSLCSTSGRPNEVWTDDRELFQKGFAWLARNGCVRPSVITSVTSPPAGEDSPSKRHHDAILGGAAAAGLDLPPERIMAAPSPHIIPWQFGQEATRTLLGQDPAPDGLIVFPDIVAQGVVGALLEANASVPEALRLALHRNVGADYFCPYSAAYLTVSPAKVAAALLALLQKQYKGERVTPVATGIVLDEPEDGTPSVPVLCPAHPERNGE